MTSKLELLFSAPFSVNTGLREGRDLAQSSGGGGATASAEGA